MKTLICLLIVLGSTLPLYSQWLANTPISTVYQSSQADPVLVSDGNGGAIIAWLDGRNGYDISNIYAQRINANGVVQWTRDGNFVCCTVASAGRGQGAPVITSDGSGGAIIAWIDARDLANGIDASDVYAQRINADGVVQWDSAGVPVCIVNGAKGSVGIISDGNGGAIIIWTDNRSGSPGIYAQKINSSGIVKWKSNGVEASGLLSGGSIPSIASDGHGGAYVTWSYLPGGGSINKVYAQKIDSDGTVNWKSDGIPVCPVKNIINQTGPLILNDGTGGAIIFWDDYRSGGTSGIYGQRINSSGTLEWDSTGFRTTPIGGTLGRGGLTSVAPDGNGNAIITRWNEIDSTLNGGIYPYDSIYAQKVDFLHHVVQWDSNGAAVSTGFSLKSTVQGVSDGNGGAYISWSNTDSSVTTVNAQRINSNSTAQWAKGGITISKPPPILEQGEIILQEPGQMISDGSGGAIITWNDRNDINNDPNVYASKLNTNGLITAIDNSPSQIPLRFHLAQNYPNPFNPSTNISFKISSPGLVSLKIYDVLGREVATLVNRRMSPGSYDVRWNAAGFASGVYFYRLRAGNAAQVKKMLYLK